MRSVLLSLAILGSVAAAACARVRGEPRVRPEVPYAASAPASPTVAIARLYPRDVGIEEHADVVFVEGFEDSLPTVLSRWTDIKNSSTMSLDPDVPAGSLGTKSLNITVTGGRNSEGHLYKLFSPGYDDTLYLRYYVKHPAANYSHNGVWIGGYNPPLPFPDPRAGACLRGNERISAAAESYGSPAHRFDHYNYWKGQRPDFDGRCWGNGLLNDPAITISPNRWVCVEQMVKLNNPVSAVNGEHAIWLDEEPVSHLGRGFPEGYWVGSRFFPNSTARRTFEGFEWRSEPALNLNWIWLLHFAPNYAAGFSAPMKFDHVVVAKSHIGCLS